jgi:hypothetical protein
MSSVKAAPSSGAVIKSTVSHMGADISGTGMETVIFTWDITICGVTSPPPGLGGGIADNPAIPTSKIRNTRKSFFTFFLYKCYRNSRIHR